MPPLSNPRHERFVQALFEGKSADEAYTSAGYHPNRHNASRLKTKETISARLAELQAEAAKASEVTVASLLQELEHARKRADSLDQLSASVKAIEAKAKVSGLLTQKIEITDTTPDIDPDANTEDIAAWVAWHYEDYRIELTDQQKVEFGLVLRDALAQIENFLAPFKARPVRVLPAKPQVEYERRRLGLSRGNGQPR